MSPAIAPAFIVIEGIDGAGTTTQTSVLTRRLNDAGFSALSSCEPTDGPIGSLIRQVLRGRLVAPVPGSPTAPLTADTLSLLFSADRLDHLQTRVIPALSQGRSLVCDRYYYSTLAYQGVEGDLEWIREINRKARRPDLVFYLRIDPDVALARLDGRAGRDIFERADFLRRVSANYDALFATEPEARILDGSRPLDELSDTIFTLTMQHLEK